MTSTIKEVPINKPFIFNKIEYTKVRKLNAKGRLTEKPIVWICSDTKGKEIPFDENVTVTLKD